MDSRQSGNDGEGCRNDGEGAGNDGLVLWSPYPKLGLTGTFTSPYGKGWSAQMASHSKTLSTTLPQRPTRPWGLTPPSPYRKLGYIIMANSTHYITPKGLVLFCTTNHYCCNFINEEREQGIVCR